MDTRNLHPKVESIDLVRKIKTLLKILYNVVDMCSSSLKGFPWCDMKVPGDLVDSDLTMYPAPLIGLLLDLLYIAFSYTLIRHRGVRVSSTLVRIKLLGIDR